MGSVQLPGGGVSLTMELGAGCSKFESSFTLDDLPDFVRSIEGLDETTEHAFYNCLVLSLFWNSFDELIAGFLLRLLVNLGVRKRFILMNSFLIG